MTRPPFTKILVANRGEIAVRIMRTARRLGYRTVAIFSDADRGAPHVAAADEAVGIGGTVPAASYLDMAKVIDAARVSGADAIHPGYGFLAENAAFADAAGAAGLRFVGPSPDAIRAMGDKAEAKRLMQAAGVPCIPGYQGGDQGDDRLFREAEGIGWPVMIKAVAGGGGRGMRLVETADAFAAALASARSEARAAFGNAQMLLERAIIDPRHVEIQIFADAHGGVIHLGERDCSVQRRHQKVIEEAPSPAVDADLRSRMGRTATEAARAIGYEGAGTFEFLLDRAGDYFFMEMNTRLQVEHPVTEAITGLDLVELQVRIAAGEPLPLTQDEVRLTGHAMEMRLCAEDPDAGFTPQSGLLSRWTPPDSLRTDHALRSDMVISPFYDSMIAKIIAHGATRDEARRKLLAGLDRTVILGLPTNRAFVARCLAHRVFASGEATTAFIAQEADGLTPPAGAAGRAAMVGAALLNALDADRALAYGGSIAMRVEVGGILHELAVMREGGGAFRVGHERIGLFDLAAGSVVVEQAGLRTTAYWSIAGDRLFLQYEGDGFTIRDRSREPVERAGGETGDGRVRASMTGRVVAVHAAIGDQVEAGQAIVTVEAMKMEQRHDAPRTGMLKTLSVAVGDQVAAGRIVAEVAP